MDFEEYFEKTGVKKGWFAREIGMNATSLSQIMAKKRSLPISYWFQVIKVSKGDITLFDIINNYSPELNNFEIVNRGQSCIITPVADLYK